VNTKIKLQIIELAEKSTEEICGFIYFTQHEAHLYPCENIAEDKVNYFEISANDYLECSKKGDIHGVYHSHVRHDCIFSELDKEMADETLFPLYLYSTQDKGFNSYWPKTYKPEPLIGRSFIWGFQDCFGLFRDSLILNKGKSLPDYDRDENFREFNFNIIESELPKQGFVEVGINELEEGDLLTFKSKGILPKHLAVYMGEGKMMHHPIGKLSIVEDVGKWATIFDKAWRPI